VPPTPRAGTIRTRLADSSHCGKNDLMTILLQSSPKLLLRRGPPALLVAYNDQRIGRQELQERILPVPAQTDYRVYCSFGQSAEFGQLALEKLQRDRRPVEGKHVRYFVRHDESQVCSQLMRKSVCRVKRSLRFAKAGKYHKNFQTGCGSLITVLLEPCLIRAG